MIDIDVVLPVRAPAPWLTETLESLKNQTNNEWRLIALVHGPEADLRRRIEAVIPRATILNVSGDCTLVDVLNQGIRSCTGRFVARLDADDVASPSRFQIQADWLRKHDRCVLVTSTVTLIDEVGKTLANSVGPVDDDALKRGLRWKNVIAHPAVMMRLDAVIAAGGYDGRASHVEDYELWMRMMRLGTFHVVNEPLTRYRTHDAQVTRTTVTPAVARRVLLASRIALARDGGESVVAVFIRHTLWSMRQDLRSLAKRIHGSG